MKRRQRAKMRKGLKVPPSVKRHDTTPQVPSACVADEMNVQAEDIFIFHKTLLRRNLEAENMKQLTLLVPVNTLTVVA